MQLHVFLGKYTLFKHGTYCKMVNGLSPSNVRNFIKIRQVTTEWQHFEIGLLITLCVKMAIEWQ